MRIDNSLKFQLYSYAEHMIWSLLNVLPHTIRNLVFRLLFKHFGHGCLLDYDVYVRYPFKVSIGNQTTINRGCRLYSSFMVKEAEIIIGSNVALAPHVTLFGGGHDYRTLDLKDTAATIRIGDYVWVGGGSCILQGVTVGEGAIIGAGSIVTRDVPAWSIALGNPARVVGTRKISDHKLSEPNSATEH